MVRGEARARTNRLRGGPPIYASVAHDNPPLFVTRRSRRRRPPEPLHLLGEPRPSKQGRRRSARGRAADSHQRQGPSRIYSACESSSMCSLPYHLHRRLRLLLGSSRARAQFGSFEAMKTQLSGSTVAVQGSGWGWLGYDKATKSVAIATCPNQVGSPPCRQPRAARRGTPITGGRDCHSLLWSSSSWAACESPA